MEEKSGWKLVLTGLRLCRGKEEATSEVQEFFRKEGSKGGKIGGRKAAESMTPAERVERARKAVAAREVERKSARKGRDE